MAQYDETERSSHFMGAVVTVPVKSVPVGVTKHLVIDGQQRLTTLAVLLGAIRDAAASIGDSSTEGIIGDLLVNRHYQAPDDLKLVPTQVDREAFKALVQGEDLAPHAETGLAQAYQFFRKKLAGCDPDDEPIIPSKTFQAVQQSLQVVMINLSETDDPYLIFESLNHKGKPLNQADLVRNYVLMRFQHSTSAGGDQEKAYQNLWRPMEERLGENMTEFLRHYGMRYGHNVRKGDIYTACKAEFERLNTADEVRNRLGEMKNGALEYQRFIHPNSEDDGEVGRLLGAIKELDSTVFYPLILRLFNGLQAGAYDKSVLTRCLQTLESFYVRRAACNVPTHGLNKLVLELCLNFPDSSPDVWLRERLAQGSKGRRWPDDAEFVEALVTQPIYSRRRIPRYMLVSLEDAHAHKEPVDPTTATIEHIMPQTLNEGWRATLGLNHASVHAKWLNTLGNLTLTGYNAELGNAPFSEKKEKLKHTHFELTRGVLEADTWGAEEIERRGRDLAKRAVARWSRV